MQRIIQRHWYHSSLTFLTFLLLPFTWVFYFLITLRRFLYRKKILRTYRFPVSIIVVGNITVGGTGKTPFVIWLADLLKANGWRPGIVSRGVGGQQQNEPRFIKDNADASLVGDEAILLANKTSCPVVICIDRVAAVNALLKNSDCNIVISDDGLQHYRLQRDLEIVLIDGERRFGNNQLLPAGPLRESQSRLQEVAFLVTQGIAQQNEFTMTLEGDQLISVKDSSKQLSLGAFKGKKVHAIAAIGNPSRFFNSLKQAGLIVQEHSFNDHHLFTAEDLNFNDELPVIMTEKDMVKCKTIATERFWYLPVSAKVDAKLEKALLTKVGNNYAHSKYFKNSIVE